MEKQSKIKLVDTRVSFPKLEDEIIEMWKEGKIFEKSVDQRDEKNKYTFVDGPPFVSGMPHYGHLLVSVVKDIIPRYWTMKGKKVRRVFGWDCHGLPIETKVNEKFGIKDRSQIENEIGVDTYVEHCRSYVEQHISDWRWYIDKVGRWVDLDHAYRTMDPEFNESVIWAFKQIHEKGLIYKGKRVSLFSTDTSTPVSEFEVAMDADNYRDMDDLSIFMKFKLKTDKYNEFTNGKDLYIVGWTTTPWTMPSNFALAVNANYQYSLVEFNGQYMVMATDRLSYAFNNENGFDMEKVKVLSEFGGKDLEGLYYEPIYDYFVDKTTENDFKIYLYEGVTIEEGTGVLHIAPAFGAEDHELGLKFGISALQDIDEKGNMTVGDWVGVYLRDASPLVAEDMNKRGNLLRSEVYTHRLPFYRGKNPLIYMAQDSYFIDVQKIKEKMLELNENVTWYPEHYKNKRVADTIKTSPDWAVSRNRYWATIMPIWKNSDGDEMVVGSFEEMMQYTDQIEKRVEEGRNVYYLDGKKLHLHRDMCDKLVLKKDGKEYKRIPEVLDCWMDSGSVPFAEYHYPFENKEKFENGFPADFIVEYSAQIRAWFNVLFRISTILFEREPYKNVLCHGVLSGNDGRKMSKSFNNYTDPKKVLETIGGEAIRLYFMSTPLMSGGDAEWSDDLLAEQVKNIMIPLWNTYRYLTLYANQYNWTPEDTEYRVNTVLDKWLKSYMDNVTFEYAKALESYDLPSSVKLIQPTIDAISTWWIRRSRDRFATGDMDALQNLYAALVQFAKTFAPQMPFLTDSMYQNLVRGTGVKGALESVHLELYPEVKEENIDKKLIEDMELVRKVCSLGLNLREEKSLKLRQPLSSAWVNLNNEDLLGIIKDELNVKEVKYVKSEKELESNENVVVKNEGGYLVALNTELTEELKEEGLYNDFVRSLQNLRKESGCKVGEQVKILFSSPDDSLRNVVKNSLDKIMSSYYVEVVEDESLADGKKQKIGDSDLLLKVVK